MDLNTVVIPIILVYFFVCLFLKISSKVSVAAGLIMLMVAAVIFTYGDKDLANNIAIIVYYLLIVAVALVIVEYCKEIRKKEEFEGEK